MAMEITAKALYDTLKMAYPGTETTLCLLHKPCVKTRRCAVVSCKEILDFLAANLGMLATTSTRWDDLCNKYLKQKLEEVADIEKRYIHCKEFDAVMSC